MSARTSQECSQGVWERPRGFVGAGTSHDVCKSPTERVRSQGRTTRRRTKEFVLESERGLRKSSTNFRDVVYVTPLWGKMKRGFSVGSRESVPVRDPGSEVGSWGGQKTQENHGQMVGGKDYLPPTRSGPFRVVTGPSR